MTEPETLTAEERGWAQSSAGYERNLLRLYDAALARAESLGRACSDAASDLAEMRTERDDAIEERDELVKYNTRLGEENKAALARAEAAEKTIADLSDDYGDLLIISNGHESALAKAETALEENEACTRQLDARLAEAIARAEYAESIPCEAAALLRDLPWNRLETFVEALSATPAPAAPSRDPVCVVADCNRDCQGHPAPAAPAPAATAAPCLVQLPVQPRECAACGLPAQGNASIHRDGMGEGPEVDLCDDCGTHELPDCPTLWRMIREQKEKRNA